MSRAQVLLWVCSFFWVLASNCWGQLDTGVISGTVTDSTGAAVPAANVTLTSELTGAVRSAASNEQGFYTFPLAPSGRYTVKVERQGFKVSEHKGLVLHVNQQLNVPFTLEVGQVTESLTVTGLALLVETTSGAIKETVDRQRISELPLNGRNVLQLQSLLPGTVAVGSLDQGANTPGYSVNGGIGASNNYSLDGGQHVDAYFNAPITFPNPDAIQEFSIQTSSYSAEYGRNRGAIINAVTKSGTNDFHGTLFEFLRNDKLDARPFTALVPPPFKRNQFGGSFGGPVKRNKLFFFGSYQGTRERGTPNTSVSRVPTDRMRRGDFSQVARALRDPLGGNFANNQIPASRLEQPVVRFLDRYIPLPNSGVFDLVIPRNRPLDGNEVVSRVDTDFGPNDRFYVRYLFNQDRVFNPGGTIEGWGIDQRFRRQSALVSETHTFSPTQLNTFSLNFNRVYSYIVPVPDFAWSEFGANIPPAAPQIFGWHVFNVTGYFNAASGTFWNLGRNNWNIEDTFSWVRGRHALRMGAQISRYQVNQLNEFLTRGNFQFNGFATGESAADAMLGRVANLRQVSPLGNVLRQTLWHFFFNDDIKASRKLSLSIGVRYEPNLHFTERDGKQTGFQPGQQSTFYPNAPLGLLFKGDPQLPPNVNKNQWKNIAPRFSFAYDLFGNGKTALRGGYGMFFDVIRSINLNRFPLIQPFVLDITMFDVQFSNPYATRQFFPFTPPSTPDQRRNFQFIIPGSTTAFNADFRTPYSQQWNLNLQRQLPWDTVLTAAYVGSKSSRLFGSHNLNPAIPGPGATVANTQQRRIYQQFGVIEDENTFGYSQYHAFQLTVNKKLSRGFTVLGAYTFSKNNGLASAQTEGSLGTRHPFERNLDKALLNEDRPQLLSISGIWQIPSGLKGAPGYILRNWQVTGILQATSGQPLTPRAGQDRSLFGQNLDTADVTGDWRIPGSRSRGEQRERWFNGRAFALPPVGSVGTAGLNVLRGPGSYNLDFGVYRDFRITEQVAVQFRGQFYNFFNHTRLSNPDTNFSSPNFGRILGTGAPRVGELGLKLVF